MVIVDTTVWVDYFRGIDNAETAWIEHQLERQRLALTDLILCEVLQGIRNSNEFVLTRNELLRFFVFINGGAELAIAAAGNYRRLREHGHTIRKTVDCLIATFCLQEGHELLHRDRDFEPFESILGMKVVHADR
jgi:predicted nucleic acid-binding protein